MAAPWPANFQLFGCTRQQPHPQQQLPPIRTEEGVISSTDTQRRATSNWICWQRSGPRNGFYEKEERPLTQSIKSSAYTEHNSRRPTN